jgi:hypothetical protein
VKGTIIMRFVEDVPQLFMQASYAIQYGAAPATAASLSSSLFDLLFKLMTSAVIVNFGHLAVRRLTASMGTEDTQCRKRKTTRASD